MSKRPTSGQGGFVHKKHASQPMVKIEPTVGLDPVSIFDIGTYQCRYPLNEAVPISEFRFCGGETKEPFGYCKIHADRCFKH